MATLAGPATASAVPPSPTPSPSLPLCTPASGSGNNRSSESSAPTTPRANRQEGQRVGVGEFIDARFASFDRAYGIKAAPIQQSTRQAAVVNAERLRDEFATSGSNDKDCESGDDGESDEAPYRQSTTSFLALLTTLYLPLLLLWLRRSMFGTANLFRSLLIGHALRLLLAYVILPPPPAWVGESWDAFRKFPPVRRLIVLVSGLFFAATAQPKEKVGHHHHHHHGVIMGCGEGWPPPALVALAVFTVVAFVVHPDGLTWIMLGKLWEGIQYLIHSSTLCLGMLRDGTVPTLAASGSLAGLIILPGIVIGVFQALSRRHKGGLTPGHGPGPNPERSRKGGKKGKKGRGRHGSGHNASGGGGGNGRIRGRGRIRGGHYRSTKVMLESPPARSRSRSRERPQELTGIGSQENNQVSEQRLQQHDQSPRNRKLSSSTADSTAPTEDDGSCCSSAYSVTPAPQLATSQSENANLNTTERADEGKKGSVSGNAGSRRKKHGRKGRKHSDGNMTNQGQSHKTTGTSTRSASSTVIAPPKSAPAGILPGVSQPTSPFLTAPTPPPSPKLGPPASPAPFQSHRNERERAATEDYRNYSSNSFFSSPPSPQLVPSRSNDGGSGHHDQKPKSSPFSPTIGPPAQPTFSPAAGSCLRHNHFDSAREHPGTTAHAGLIGSRSATGMTGASALRYSVPNYAGSYSYAKGDGRYTPGKIELAAFLAQVGLIGAACADLLADLADVDALAKLTPTEYEMYKIGPGKQAEIGAMLEARRRRQEQEKQAAQQQQRQWSAPVVRPPPGFSREEVAMGRNGGDGPTVAPVGVAESQLPFLSSAGGSGYGLTGLQQNQTRDQRVSLSHGNESSFSGGLVDGVGVGLNGVSGTFTQVAFGGVEHSTRVQEQEDSSKIEADLQELGGRMVGSILDF